MGGWPAWLNTVDVDQGTCYVSPGVVGRMIERHGNAGQAWKMHGRWSSYCPNTRITYKTAARLLPHDETDFRAIMREAQESGARPPVSFTDLFLHVMPFRAPRRTVIAPFHNLSFGGWEECFWKGMWREPAWYYDLNKAYRWAATVEPLPDLTTAYKISTIQSGIPACYLMDLAPGALPWIRARGRYLIPHELLPLLAIPAIRGVVKGVAFRDSFDLRPIFTDVDRLYPYCRDRIGRAFWGAWNGVHGPDRVTWKRGTTVRPQRNIFYNPIWAAYITGRIKLRLAPFVKSKLVLTLFVDSLLTKEELPTGSDPGQWRLLGQFVNGVWIRGAAHWGTGTTVVKHSGLASDRLPMV